MYSLIQSTRVRGAAGEPLPSVFQSLDALGVQFRRGQLVLVAAGPGTGKSIFVLTQALKSRASTLYLSADSDAFTQLTRSISVMTGNTLASASEAVLSNELGDLADRLAGVPIRFNYEASPTLDTIETSVEAYEEVYGRYPDLIVVDNVSDVFLGGNEEEGLDGLVGYLNTMARNTESCVVGLHHVTGPYNDGDKPIPLSGVKQQIGRVPQIILTMFKRRQEGASDILCVSPVKNRGSKFDSSGNTYAELSFEGDKMQIRDLSEGQYSTLTERDPWQ